MAACENFFDSNNAPKYFESKFNKDLQKSKTFRLVLQWLETAEFPQDDEVDGVQSCS
jgi:hypothetical protein